MGAKPGNRNAARRELPDRKVLDAYLRLIACGFISVRRASKELDMAWSTLNAMRRRAPSGDDTDMRSQHLLRKAMSGKRGAEMAKRERLRADIKLQQSGFKGLS